MAREQVDQESGWEGGTGEQVDMESGGGYDTGFLEDLEGEGENKIGGLGRHPVHGDHLDCEKVRNWLN